MCAYVNLLKGVVKSEVFLNSRSISSSYNSLSSSYIFFPDNRFPKKDVPKVPNSTDKKPPFCSFVSFLNSFQ